MKQENAQLLAISIQNNSIRIGNEWLQVADSLDMTSLKRLVPYTFEFNEAGEVISATVEEATPVPSKKPRLAAATKAEVVSEATDTNPMSLSQKVVENALSNPKVTPPVLTTAPRIVQDADTSPAVKETPFVEQTPSAQGTETTPAPQPTAPLATSVPTPEVSPGISETIAPSAAPAQFDESRNLRVDAVEIAMRFFEKTQPQGKSRANPPFTLEEVLAVADRFMDYYSSGSDKKGAEGK